MSAEGVDILAKRIWEYMHMHHILKKADCIFVLGSYDRRVGHYAAELFLQGYAPFILFSGGGQHEESKKRFLKTEAETFAEIAVYAGVPAESIIIEKAARNTVENIEYSKKLLKENGLNFNSFILVQKPSNERRSYAAFRRWWPDRECIVTSPPISYEEYPNEEISKDLMINSMVGDFQRIKVYAEKGWQVPQEIPEDVWCAYKELVRIGFNKSLVKE